jgi:hypothetical protein
MEWRNKGISSIEIQIKSTQKNLSSADCFPNLFQPLFLPKKYKKLTVVTWGRPLMDAAVLTRELAATRRMSA